MGSTKEQRDNRRHLWSGAPDCPVCHRTCPVHQRTPTSNSSPSGNSRGDSAIIHQTVRYTPDCPVQQRGNGYFGANGYLRRIKCALRAQRSGTPILAHRTLNSTCPVRHRTSRRAQKSELQRSESIGIGDVAGAPDCPVHHTTDSLHQRLCLVVGEIGRAHV